MTIGHNRLSEDVGKWIELRTDVQWMSSCRALEKKRSRREQLIGHTVHCDATVDIQDVHER